MPCWATWQCSIVRRHGRKKCPRKISPPPIRPKPKIAASVICERMTSWWYLEDPSIHTNICSIYTSEDMEANLIVRCKNKKVLPVISSVNFKFRMALFTTPPTKKQTPTYLHHPLNCSNITSQLLITGAIRSRPAGNLSNDASTLPVQTPWQMPGSSHLQQDLMSSNS